MGGRFFLGGRISPLTLSLPGRNLPPKFSFRGEILSIWQVFGTVFGAFLVHFWPLELHENVKFSSLAPSALAISSNPLWGGDAPKNDCSWACAFGDVFKIVHLAVDTDRVKIVLQCKLSGETELCAQSYISSQQSTFRLLQEKPPVFASISRVTQPRTACGSWTFCFAWKQSLSTR